MQTKTAQAVAHKLRSNLSLQEKAAIAEPPTADLKAYELYTRAKAIDPWDTPGGAVPNINQKIAFLSEAVQRDPSFALAYCELAKSQFDIEDLVRDGAHLILGKAAVETALQLRPGPELTYRELARYSLFTADYEHGSEDAAIALCALPNDAQAFRVAARIACYLNHWKGGRGWLEKTFAMDPLDVEIEHDLFDIYQAMRLYPQWMRVLAAHRTFGALDGGWTDMQRAKLKLDVGDVKAAREFLARVPPDSTRRRKSGKPGSPPPFTPGITTRRRNSSPRRRMNGPTGFILETRR